MDSQHYVPIEEYANVLERQPVSKLFHPTDNHSYEAIEGLRVFPIQRPWNKRIYPTEYPDYDLI